MKMLSPKLNELHSAAWLDVSKGLNNCELQSHEFESAVNAKFAKLIIEDCINLLPEDCRDPRTKIHLGYVLLNHFGVE